MAIKTYRPKSPSVGRTFNGRKEIDNLYDHAWEKYRAAFLKENPNCYRCGERATIVDHMTPHKGNVLTFKNTSNHMPLCKCCHDTATGRFDKYHVPGSLKKKLEWISYERSRRGINSAIKVLPSYVVGTSSRS